MQMTLRHRNVCFCFPSGNTAVQSGTHNIERWFLMQIIRNTQIEIFEKPIDQEFEDLMLARVKTFSPSHSRVIGDEGLREVIRIGIGKAGSQMPDRPARLAGV
jgi:hypothetical protein